MNNNNAQMIPDGTYRSAVGTLNVSNGVATLLASTWADAEDGRHGACPAQRMTAQTVCQYQWWRDGVCYGDLS
jgi:hypothetical protein